ncbi:MAG: phospho-sugar mutase [Opitutales bacterium]
MKDLVEQVQAAGVAGDLLESSVRNLTAWLDGGFLPAWAADSLRELIEGQEWAELNDRFYKALAFGTGGMRSRTIGRVLTAVEKGTLGPQGTPEHAAVGTAYLNDFNIVRATMGLYRYAERHLCNLGKTEKPKIVIAHDVRHFSQHFTALAASTWAKLGGEAFIFDGPRSTPQLSFTVRATEATAGVVITASHNPSHDNGYKVYFEDGAQVVFPHAEGIINEVYQVDLAETPAYFEVDLGKITTLGVEMDKAYQDALLENVLVPETFKAAEKPSIVFTAIHGVGGVTAPGMLRRLGLPVDEVPTQAVQDPRFPSVKSPNPENAEALSMAIEQAKQSGGEIVLATDPDADRMGVAVRREDGSFTLLTGNQIGSLLAAYRTQKLKDLKALPVDGTRCAALVTTFVTTPLQEAIGRKHQVKVIKTLTGFKWIGEKLRLWEEELLFKLKEQGRAVKFDELPANERRLLLLEHSTYFIFGTEESYGYLGNDRVRDKDANAAVIMFAEMAADLKQQGKTILEYLDEVYLRFGYYNESVINIYYEGAAGAQKIKQILESYRSDPPKQIGEYGVTAFNDFGTQTFHDADEKEIPKQDFYIIELDNGYRYAVRGSGTEPKIKFYLFAQEDVSEPGDLDRAKEAASDTLEALKKAIDADARQRAER